MSKRSLFWSTASGKLGDIVLSQRQGETIARKYQPQVLNPRSEAQMLIRVPFATAVKFYRHATDNFFRFAFEDKRKNESDYNAFMRYNAKRGCIVSKVMNDTYTYPAWGENWQLSNGSLQEIIYNVQDNNVIIPMPNLPELDDPEQDITLEDISKAFVEQLGFNYGDYITIVRIRTSYTSYEIAEGLPAPRWDIVQFQLIEDNTPINGYNIEFEWQAGNSISFKLNETGTTTAASCVAIIASRNTANKLLVSPSYCIGNEMYNKIVDNFMSDTAIAINLASWGATQDAILKGRIAKALNEYNGVDPYMTTSEVNYEEKIDTTPIDGKPIRNDMSLINAQKKSEETKK